jgi:hypothetical protein
MIDAMSLYSSASRGYNRGARAVPDTREAVEVWIKPQNLNENVVKLGKFYLIIVEIIPIHGPRKSSV